MWKRILIKELPNDKKKAVAIADHIANEIKNGTIALHSPVPPYRMMAEYMNLSKSVLQQSFSILKNSYKMIETRRGGGTRVIYSNNGNKFQRPDHKVNRLLFDHSSIAEVNGDSTSFKAKYNDTYGQFMKLSDAELDLKMPLGLIHQAGLLVSKDLGHDFADYQLLCTDNYELMIYNLCRLFLTEGKVFVMAHSAINLVERSVRTAGKDIAFLKAESSGLMMDELEALCKIKNPGIVYLSSGAPYPVNWFGDQVKMNRLKALQAEYLFIVLLDNRYPGLISISELEPMIKEFDNSSVLYLRPATLLNRKLSEINVIAGPKKMISALKKQYKGPGMLMCPIIAYTLWELLELGVINKYEKKLFGKIPELMEVARSVFRESGLWKEKFISGNKGWFFYLEPLAGNLPEDIYEQLLAEQIYTINRSNSHHEGNFGKGVLISTAAYLNKFRLAPDLSRLIKACEKKIKY